MFFKKLLFATTLLSIATIISIAGYLFFAKRESALAQTTGNTYYVSNGATGSWAGAVNRNTPCSYLIANNNAVAGDTVVYINDGGDFNIADMIIRPVNNGLPGNPITFKGEDNTMVILKANGNSAYLSGKSYITIENFTIRNGGGNSWIFMRNTAAYGNGITHHIIIQNNTFEATISTWGGIYGSGNTHHIYILNNIIKGGVSSANAQGDVVYFVPTTGYSADHILIEGNDIEGGGHNALDFQSAGGMVEYIIVRNNKIHNPNHTSFSIYGSAGTRPQHILVENNLIYDGGAICGVNSCPGNVSGSAEDQARPREQHPNLQLSGNDNIIRNNVLYNGGRSIDIENTTNNNRIYNNVFYKNVQGIYFNTTLDVNGNVFKNNAFKSNTLQGTYANSPLYVDLAGANCVNEWAYNNFDELNDIRYKDCVYNYAWKALSYLEANIPLIFHNGNKYNSGFVNESAYDFHLQSNSPLINAGGFLAKTNGAGNDSNTIIVNDARYFTDGLGLIAGDTIQLEGQTAPLIITNVDYSTNIITIDQNISWNDAQGVSLAYKGSAPDIGAYEYIQSSPPLKGDFNSDKKVNDLDFTDFKNAFKSIFNSLFDLNSDSIIDVKDLGVLMNGWLE